MSTNKVLKCLYGNADYKTFSLLVVANEFVSKHLLGMFRQLHEQKTYNLKLITCKAVEEILHFVNEMPIDYIVFVLDARYPDCVQQLEKNLATIEQSLVCGRMCVVNGISSASPPGLDHLKAKYHCPVLSAHILDTRSCQHLVTQIGNLIRSTSGFASNSVLIPWLLDFPDQV